MATPEKQPGLSFFLPNVYVASLQTAHENRQLEIFVRSKQAARRASRARCLNFMSLRSKPLENYCRAEFFLHLKQAAQRASRLRCLTIFSLRSRPLGSIDWIVNLKFLYSTSSRTPSMRPRLLQRPN